MNTIGCIKSLGLMCQDCLKQYGMEMQISCPRIVLQIAVVQILSDKLFDKLYTDISYACLIKSQYKLFLWRVCVCRKTVFKYVKAT